MDIKDLTFAGWMLLIITCIGALGIGFPIMLAIGYALPDGARYPKIIGLAPVVLTGLGIFYGGTIVLKKMGKPISRK